MIINGVEIPDNPQQGAWYSGRQYWNGSLSEPGQINPQSNQQGAGQQVSKEVVQQTAPGNWDYIQQQRQQAGVQPGGAGQITPMGAGEGMGAGIQTPETINLPSIYQNLYKQSGVADLESKYSQMERDYIEAKGKINDNPFLSEATRVGRVAKIEQLFQERTANIKGDIATKKADIETQLNLQMKQFDIESTAAQNALNQLNSLLSMGALDNASGEDIASLTRSTGISSSMIYSAINASKQKNKDTQLITSTAENGEVFSVLVDKQTGEIIKKTSLGVIGNVQGSGGGGGTGNYKESFIEEADTIQGQAIDNEWVGQFPLLVAKYAPYMSLQDIYRLYSQSSLGQSYGTPGEDPEYIKEIYNQAKGG